MDPIHPITPGPPALPSAGLPPVERLERIARERDRPSKRREQPRRERKGEQQPEHGYRDDEGNPHIDVRV
jgi:hypothetical protein